MKRLLLCILVILLPVISGCASQESMEVLAQEYSRMSPYEITMRKDLLSLMLAYPEYIKKIDKSDSGLVYAVLKSGKRVVYDDKKEKSYDEKLNNADLQDMMELLYPVGDIDKLMPENFDPGRIRVYSLLKEVYGDSKQNIMSNLENVKAGGKNCSFSKNNSASKALREAFGEITSLIGQGKNIYSFVFPVNGTFNYRIIAGTNQLSPHSFGIAIDLKSDKRDYWRWATREQGQERLDTYPRDVVKAFERNNFVWGGKWGHFDILHFEYRPELIIKAKYHVSDHEATAPWYYGFPSDESNVKEAIKIIDEGLR